ncbi:transglycosylase domain-containing protein [Kitasatospora sp. NPDC059571]|uniref:transglycosylase domain-containing protein n=1 Tax=Kitasatospora sp. NPDC059571 TaxID=3346871 RepID=UPI00368C3DB8
MGGVRHFLIGLRRRRRARAALRRARRLLPTRRQLLAGLLASAALLAGAVGWFWETTDVPDDLNAFATQQNNVFYWSDGTEMARTGQVNRQEVPLDRVPGPVRWAVVSAENETFYSDPGVSVTGIGRAVVRMATGGDTQGGSTITQQYVKNIYLNQRQDVSRKLSEIVIAVKLDQRMDKDDILAGYLNTSWFGRGSYGIERAAAAYYGKDVSALDPSEGAFLAALLKGAGLYDPALGPENRTRAVARWSWILDRMVATGHLSAAERARYTVFPEPVAPRPAAGLGGQTGYLVDMARTYLEGHSDITPARFDLGGFQIRTTFDRRRTAALADAVKSAGPALDPAGRAADQHVHIGAASVAADGRITALYGGPDYLKQGFNDANTSNVPVGTAFTPLVYAAGLAQGVQHERGGRRTAVHPATPYDGNDGTVVTTPEGPYWGRDGRIAKAVNDDRRSWGRISLRTAVAQSVNGPMMQLGMDVGLEGVRRGAVALGLLPDSLGELVPAFSLGNSRPSTVRMASAFTAFPNGGRHTDPYSVDRVTLGGAPVAVARPAAAQVLDPAVAGEVDDALRAAVREGTGKDAAGAAPDAAGKTGTTADHTAGWFVGSSGGTATAVTVFRMDPRTLELYPLDGLGGSDPAAPASAFPTRIWAAYTRSGG